MRRDVLTSFVNTDTAGDLHLLGAAAPKSKVKTVSLSEF
jgi:hypothetical protein